MKRTHKKRNEHGAVIVEFALVLPLLMLLLMGIIEFGLLFYNQQVLTNASREGARAGIAHLDQSDIENIVIDYCTDRLIRFNTTIDPVPSVPNPPPLAYGEDLTVAVNYDYTFLVPGLLGFGPNISLTAETVMTMEMEMAP